MNDDINLMGDEDDEPTIVHDAIGQGIDLQIFRNRGILSLVLVDSANLIPIGPSAEVEASDLLAALKQLGIA